MSFISVDNGLFRNEPLEILNSLHTNYAAMMDVNESDAPHSKVFKVEIMQVCPVYYAAWRAFITAFKRVSVSTHVTLNSISAGKVTSGKLQNFTAISYLDTYVKK